MSNTEIREFGGVKLPVRTTPFAARADLGDEERAAVLRVLDSGVLSGFVGSPGDHHLGGPEVRALEAAWQQLGGHRHVVAVNSATAALHAGVRALDLPAGTEVIVPPYTMSATIAAVEMAGLVPVFADIDPDVFTLTAATVEEVMTSRTGAVLPVHLFGQMAPMAGLQALAKQHGLQILEDAAQAPGATHDGVRPGRGTSGAIYSFNQHKTITCGEGGLLVTDDDRVATVARLVRNHAESVVHAFPEVDPVGLIGWNYRLTELEAAVALAQTAKLERLTAWREDRAAQLTRGLDAIPGLRPPAVAEGNRHVWFTYAVRFDAATWGCDRETLVSALRLAGVPCAAGYVTPLYRLALFGSDADPRRDPTNFPTCERLATQELLLLAVCGWPSTEQDIDHAIDALAACWEQRARLGQLGAT